MKIYYSILLFLLGSLPVLAQDNCRALIHEDKRLDDLAIEFDKIGYDVIRTNEESYEKVMQKNDFIVQAEFVKKRSFYSPFTAFTDCTLFLNVYWAQPDQNNIITPHGHIFTARQNLKTRTNAMKKSCKEAMMRAMQEMNTCPRILSNHYKYSLNDDPVDKENFFLFWISYRGD